MRVWNYNKSAEDASRGVRWLRVELDGALLSPARGFELRKAPGHARFDFGQTLHLHPHAPPDAPPPADAADAAAAAAADAVARWRTGRGRHVPVAQDYFAPVHPRGLSIRLRLLTSWGDPHYLGLDALQVAVVVPAVVVVLVVVTFHVSHDVTFHVADVRRARRALMHSRAHARRRAPRRHQRSRAYLRRPTHRPQAIPEPGRSTGGVAGGEWRRGATGRRAAAASGHCEGRGGRVAVAMGAGRGERDVHLPYMATTFLIWQVFRYFEERTPESRVEVRRNTPFGTFLIWQPLA